MPPENGIVRERTVQTARETKTENGINLVSVRQVQDSLCKDWKVKSDGGTSPGGKQQKDRESLKKKRRGKEGAISGRRPCL